MQVPWPSRKLPRGQLYFEPGFVFRESARYWRRDLTRGPVVQRFEEEFARWSGARHAITLPRARLALHFLLKSLQLPPGSEVALTPVTIPDIVNVILLAGLKPLFVDLGARTGNIDPEDLERVLTPRTRVLLLTHLCGIPSQMDRVMDIARRHDLTVLEDCSQVMGARFQGRPLGLFGQAGFYSLTTLKPLSTFHGGLVITNDDKLAEQLGKEAASLPSPDRERFIRMFGRDIAMHLASQPDLFSTTTYWAMCASERWNPEFVSQFQRGNIFNAKDKATRVFRRERFPAEMFVQYTDYQASLGLRALALLDDGNRHRRELSELLLKRLRDASCPGLPEIPEGSGCTFWRFPLWVREPPAFREALRTRGVDTALTNLSCLSREPAFAECARDTPHAREYVERMVFLPMHPNLTERDIVRVADAVIDYFAGGGR